MTMVGLRGGGELPDHSMSVFGGSTCYLCLMYSSPGSGTSTTNWFSAPESRAKGRAELTLERWGSLSNSNC